MPTLSFIQTIPITCTTCGKKVTGYYAKGSEWWDEFVEDGEEICFFCIKDREGFAEAFKRMTGINIDYYEKNVMGL